MQTFRLLSAAALSATLAKAQWYSASTSFVFSESCTTSFGTEWVHPIPTDYVRFSTTITEAEPMATELTTIYVTGDTTTTYAPTSWAYTTYYTTITKDVTTVTHRVPATTTIATATEAVTVCTNGVTPQTTITSYTGTYTPIPGQPTVLPTTYETSDFCEEYMTELLHIWPTVQGEGYTTSTITPSTQGTETVHSTASYTWYNTVYRSTAYVTAVSYAVEWATPTVSAACAPTETATYAAQCAPENLVAEMDGFGLDIGNFHPNFTFAGVYNMQANRDPGACCQLCVENEGCVVGVYWAMSNSCLLGYIGGADHCGVAFDYEAINYPEVPTKPRQGNVFGLGSSGCGSIRYGGVRTS